MASSPRSEAVAASAVGSTTLVFDCDGVLLVSNRMKAGVFGDAAEAAGFHPEDVKAFYRHVLANFGTSRVRLFEHLLARDGLKHRPSVDVPQLVQLYAERLYGRYLKCSTTPSMRQCLAEAKDRSIPMYIVSGSEQAELRRLMGERKLDHHFVDIFGSPTSKAEHLERIIADLGIGSADRKRVLFVGDAEADWKAAAQTGTSFVYMDQYSTAKGRMRELEADHGFPRIWNLAELTPLLDRF